MENIPRAHKRKIHSLENTTHILKHLLHLLTQFILSPLIFPTPHCVLWGESCYGDRDKGAELEGRGERLLNLGGSRACVQAGSEMPRSSLSSMEFSKIQARLSPPFAYVPGKQHSWQSDIDMPVVVTEPENRP